MKICPKCNASLDDSSEICYNCNYTLEKKEVSFKEPTQTTNKCPKCNAEIEPGFDVCWNCNFSFSDEQILEFQEVTEKSSPINCIRCQNTMEYSGQMVFKKENNQKIFEEYFETSDEENPLTMLTCPKCGKVEFFSTQILNNL